MVAADGCIAADHVRRENTGKHSVLSVCMSFKTIPEREMMGRRQRKNEENYKTF
jgi:hypothetical protein